MQTPCKEVQFSFFSVCCIVFNCTWQLMMFDKSKKVYVKRMHLVTDDGLYDWKAFFKEKKFFYSSSMKDIYNSLHSRRSPEIMRVEDGWC